MQCIKIILILGLISKFIQWVKMGLNMKVKKLPVKIGICVFFAVLMILPLIMMFNLSEREMAKYQVNSTYKFKEAAYGESKRVTRQDLRLYYTFSGTVTSSTYRYIDFPEAEDTDVISTVSVGDEVFKGDIVAYIGGKKIISNFNGIVEDVASFAGGYVKLRSFDNLKLACMSDISTINKVKDCQTLELADGNKVNVDLVSNIIADNKRKIVFSIENSDYMYGQEVKNLKIYTGKVYTDVLTIDKQCVYQKKKNGPYFVRVVDENGYFESEKEVEIGFETEDAVSVLNIEEDTLCDAGYKELLKMQVE